MKPIVPYWTACNEDAEIDSCILAIPGRAQFGSDMAKAYASLTLPNTIIIGITPSKLEWYPIPCGAHDQNEAVDGQSQALETLEFVLELIEAKYNVPKSRTALVGYSAGGVMSLKMLESSTERFAGVVCHSGAILEPDKLTEAKTKTPVLLLHCKDDTTFAWDERFGPMYKALKRNKYNLNTAIREFGGHKFGWEDVLLGIEFLAPKLGYELDADTIGRSIQKIRRKVKFNKKYSDSDFVVVRNNVEIDEDWKFYYEWLREHRD